MARRPAIIATALSAVALTAALVITPIALANNAPAAAPATGLDQAMVAELARTLNISPDQALARVGREAAFSGIENSLRASLGDEFGGAYLNGDASTLSVGVTNSGLSARVRAAGAVPVRVDRSEAKLKSIAADLDQRAARAPKLVPGWYVDVVNNTVVVLHRAGGLDAAKTWAGAGVRFQETTEDPRPLIDIIGGNAYYIGSGTRCSIGFAVTGGFVTAGHCGTTGASTTQPSGSFAGSSFPGNDYAWVRAAAGNTPRPLVNRYPGTVSVTGSQQAAVGAAVCRSGSTTQWRCGTVAAYNSSVTYPQGTVSGLIRTNVCAQPGDSGGSLLAGTQAQGVTSGGSGNCTSGGTTYFQPVNEILQVYGLTLTITGGTTPPPPPTTTAPPPTSPPPGGCGGLPGWNASTSYSPGQSVSHNGRRWESTWWSTGAVPGAPSSWAAWADRGSC